MAPQGSFLAGFFLDPSGAHKLGNIGLSALLECLPNQQGQVLDCSQLCQPPEREVSAPHGGRIDLFLESDGWVMVLENKIFHHQNTSNPELASKVQLLVVLSPSGTAPEGWLGISYQQLLEQLSNKLAQAFIHQPFNKWQLLLHKL